jgi:predicted PurR-regulated permease PerM
VDEKKETDDNATKSEYVPPPREVDLDAPSRILLHMPVDIRSMALAIIAALAVLAVLRWAQGFFIPLMLGFVFYYALSPVVDAMVRVRIPRALGAAVLILGILGTTGAGIYSLADDASELVNSLPQAAQKVRDSMRKRENKQATTLETVQKAAAELERAAEDASTAAPASRAVQRVVVERPRFNVHDYLVTGTMGLLAVAAQVTLVIFLTYFLLLSGNTFRRKLVKITGPSLAKKKITVQALDEINGQIQLHQQVALDLAVDLVERLHGDFLFRQAGAGDLDQLAPEGIARQEEKVGQENHQRDLCRDGQQAHGAGHQVVVVERPRFNVHDYLVTGTMGLLAVAAQVTLVIFLTYFLLLSGNTFRRKLVKITGPSLAKKKITVQALDEINGQIQRYLLVQLVASVAVGICTGVAFALLGLKHAAVWGVAAGILNLIPYIGSLAVTAGASVVGFVQFGDVDMALLIGGVSLLINVIEGNLLVPWATSKASRMNPVAVFVGVLAWGWLWGVWGLLLGIPVMMVIKAVCDRVDQPQADRRTARDLISAAPVRPAFAAHQQRWPAGAGCPAPPIRPRPRPGAVLPGWQGARRVPSGW